MMCDGPSVELSAKIQQNCVKVKLKLFSLEQMAGRLRAERKARGLNQADFGALGGVGLQTQSRYEKAETEPAASYLAQIALAGVDVKYVLTGERSGESLSHDVADAAVALEAMAGTARDSFIRLIKAFDSHPPLKPSPFVGRQQ